MKTIVSALLLSLVASACHHPRGTLALPPGHPASPMTAEAPPPVASGTLDGDTAAEPKAAPAAPDHHGGHR